MNRYSAIFIGTGIFALFFSFLFSLRFSGFIEDFSVGILALFFALVFEIDDVKTASEKFEDKKRVVHEWDGPSFGTETKGGSQ